MKSCVYINYFSLILISVKLDFFLFISISFIKTISMLHIKAYRFLFYFFGNARDQTQDLAHVRQTLYYRTLSLAQDF